ncbi:methyltransferase-like protein 17, mitochondrial [Zingiber officinale]|uniref:methyltransferase-like protein 17, mitochondrial n=1 Tax=Zingiber officinale TaxID=94328 RepID=UPI001C4C965D|nr:methyltransferase-like protein 17, mitochondrial [Zingiber officinale]
MAASLLPEVSPKIFTAETLRAAAKQSQGIHLIPVSLRRTIKKFLRERKNGHMNRKVLLLSQSFNKIKYANLQLTASASRDLVENPFRPVVLRSGRWKIQSAYGDIGVKYSEDETVAYVASRMPAIYSACHRVLREVRRRVPEFSPSKVLDFGAGPGSALWAMREVWPRSLDRVNLVEPSKSMQRAAQSLLQDLKGLPVIHSYDSIQALNRSLDKHDRRHDLVISSYALGEIPSLSDRITILRQLWDLTQDVLVLLEPGTPHGSKIITQMRSYILWMENRKCRKKLGLSNSISSDVKSIVRQDDMLKDGAFVVAPCPHDGRCPLENTGKYCHFVQRLERTTSQRAYKRSKGEPLRGFEDEKFCFVALRRGSRPQAGWPLDGMEFETLKERLAKRNPEDLIIDFEDQFPTRNDEESSFENALVPYASDTAETNLFHQNDKEDYDEDVHANLGSGWGRIIYPPVRRGRQVQMDVCKSTKRDGSEGAFEHVVVTQRKNPDLHRQARRSHWGDLWPC